MKKFLKEILPYILIIVVVVLIRSFIVTPVSVDGDSMLPNLKNGNILILKKYDKSIKRFDIVVFDYEKERLIKRVIGLPGETVKIKNDKLYINNKEVKQNFERNSLTDDFDLNDIGYKKIPKGYYFVMGDNRGNSLDSRMIGLVKKSDIDGTVDLSVIPPKKIRS